MDADRLRKLVVIGPLLLALLVGTALGFLLRRDVATSGADPQAIAAATLISVREQGRQIVYNARFSAIATASETRLGMTARKTLIMPGAARYSVDLSRLRHENLAWDEATRTLTLTLPPLEMSGPQIDLNQVQEYGDGGLIMALTNAEATLDETNRRAGQQDLMRQARGPGPMGEARAAAMRDVARAFALPMRAAGIDASVAVRFVDSAGREQASFLDRPRRIDDTIRARTK
jgi:hypothetical protein